MATAIGSVIPGATKTRRLEEASIAAIRVASLMLITEPGVMAQWE